MKRKLFLILLVLVVLATFTYIYLDRIFFPVKFKQIIEKKATATLHRKTTIQEIDLNLFKGIVLADVKIYEPNSDKLFIHLENLYLKVLFAPFVKAHHIIIPSIRLKNPYIHLSRNSETVWNFSDLIHLSSSDGISKQIFLRKLILQNGIIELTDNSQPVQLQETLKSVNIDTVASLTKGVLFKISAQIPQRNSSLQTEGHYDFKNKSLTTKIITQNLALAAYLPYIIKLNGLTLSDGYIPSADILVKSDGKTVQVSGQLALSQLNATLIDNQQLSGNISFTEFAFGWQPNKMVFSGGIAGQNLNAYFPALFKYTGHVSSSVQQFIYTPYSFNFNGDINLQKTDLNITPNKSFKGDVAAQQIQFSHSAKGTELAGNIALQNPQIAIDQQNLTANEIHADQIQFHINQNIFSFQSSVNAININFKNPTYHVQSNLNASLAKATNASGKLSVQSNITLQALSFLTAPYRGSAQSFTIPNAELLMDLNATHLKGSFKNENLTIFMNADQRFSGNTFGEANLTYDKLAEQKLQYNGFVVLQQALVTGLPTLDTIEAINGKIIFDNNYLSIESLTGLSKGMAINALGRIDNFQRPWGNVTASLKNIDLQNVSSLLSTKFKRDDFQLTGEASAKLNFKGPVFFPQEADLQFNAFLNNATLSTQVLSQPITNIVGKIDYEKNKLAWHNLRGRVLGAEYATNGALVNFDMPLINTTLTGANLKLVSQIKIKDNTIHIHELKGNYFNAQCNLSGQIILGSPSGPSIATKGLVQLDLFDLALMFPSMKTEIIKYNPKGILTGQIALSGKLNNWKNWQASLIAQSPKISIADFDLDNLNLDYTQKNQTIDQFNITSQFYDGALNIKANTDLKDISSQSQLTVNLKDLNLAKLRKEKKLSPDTLAGRFSLFFNMNGPLTQQDLWKGAGSASLLNGFLGQLIPQYEDAYFTDAQSEFMIENRKILTKNTKIFSKTVILDAQGWIDFDQNLYFDIVPTVSELMVQGPNNTEVNPSALLRQAFSIECMGTLAKPTCKANTTPLKIIGNTSDFLRQGIGNILEGLF